MTKKNRNPTRSYRTNLVSSYGSKSKQGYVLRQLDHIVNTNGWESAHCDLHDGPFKGRPHHLSDGRVACANCFSNANLFKPDLRLPKR